MDPLIQLAFNIYSSPGVFVPLLGSGISRSAGIPTGWEVVIDLVRQLAALEEEECGLDPEAWFIERYGKQPDYSLLLDQLTPTPTLRQQRLRSYFEPTEEERDQGKKIPTAAHKAISRLVKAGAIRVIITTNFDRLMELALEADGIVPTIIDGPDAAKGAIPIVHSDCTLIKVHGDYLDTRIKNSTAELGQYDDTMDQLLDQVFDDFGLIVCGWSADYDIALRAAIKRTPSRRYPLYWATRGIPSEAAGNLIKSRKAVAIEINSADEFFTLLEQKHEAIKRFSQPHPLSKEAAANTLKRYLSEERFKIDLWDFVKAETRRSKQAVIAVDKRGAVGNTDLLEFLHRVKSYEEGSAVLRRLFAVGSYWASPRTSELWSDCFASIIASDLDASGNADYLNIRAYPALLLKYCIGISAMLTGRYEVFANICRKKLPGPFARGDQIGISIINNKIIRPDLSNHLQNSALETNLSYYTPLSDYIHDLLSEDFEEFIVDQKEYTRSFDKYEYLAGLVHLDLVLEANPDTHIALPVGAYRHRNWDSYGGGSHIGKEIRGEIEKFGENWAPLKAGLFGGNISRAITIWEKANKFLQSSSFAQWQL